MNNCFGLRFNLQKCGYAEYDISKLDYLKNKKIMLFGDSNTSDRISFGKILEKILPFQVIDGVGPYLSSKEFSLK